VIALTGTGDRHRPEWPIGMAGIRTPKSRENKSPPSAHDFDSFDNTGGTAGDRLMGGKGK
jgi:hypothetical protein